MSRTTKEGKRRWRNFKSPPGREGGLHEALMKRHTYGRTEKILRRNRKLWTRLLGKRRRRLDGLAIKTSQE